MHGLSRMPMGKREMPPSKLRNFAFSLFYLLFLIGVAIFALTRPMHSWDTLPYVALTLALEGKDTKTAHDEAYQRVKEALPPRAYQALLSGTEYRRAMADNSDYFSNQLPFYSIKPLYIGLIWLFHAVGVDVVQATVMVSAVSAIVLGLIIGLWITQHISGLLGYLFAIGVTVGAGLIELARLARPDALSAAIVILAIYLLLERKSFKTSLALLILSVLARPDNLIFALFVGGYLGFLSPPDLRISRIISLIYAAIVFGVYFLISSMSHAYGWEVTIYHGFISRLNAPSLAHAHISLSLYLHILYWAILESIGSVDFYYLLAFITLACILSFVALVRRSTGPQEHMLLMLAGVAVMHFLVFPSVELRFFSAYYLAIAAIGVIKGTHQLTGNALLAGGQMSSPLS